MESGESTKRARSRLLPCSTRPRLSECSGRRPPPWASSTRDPNPSNGSRQPGSHEGPSASEVEPTHVGIVQEGLARALILVFPGLEDIRSMREGQRLPSVLLDEDDCNPAFINLPDFVENHRNEARRQAC